MDELIAGFLRFRSQAFPEKEALFQKLALAQSPETLFIACSDSRVVPELLTQQDPGAMFVIRNAGNIVPSYGQEPGGVSASVEYAVAILKVRDIVICGHSNCGAMTAVAQNLDLEHVPAVSSWLRHADAAKAINQSHHHGSDAERVDGMVRENVKIQIINLRTHPSVALGLAQGNLPLHGWVFDIATGEIDALDGNSSEFVSLAENPTVVAYPRRP